MIEYQMEQILTFNCSLKFLKNNCQELTHKIRLYNENELLKILYNGETNENVVRKIMIMTYGKCSWINVCVCVYLYLVVVSPTREK